MGNKILEQRANEFKENDSSYRIVKFLSSELPSEYKNLVIAPFLNSLRYGNELFKLIDKEIYYHYYSIYIERLMEKPMAHLRLAMLNDNTVLGWSFSDHKTLHYIWVKKEVRRQGIANALLPKDIEFISHVTNKGLSMWASKFPQARFNPFV